MVFSELILKIPYSIAWRIINTFRKKKEISFYCDNELDYIVFKNIHKHLNNITFIAKNKKVQEDLKKYNIESKLYPQFPNVLIIARVSLHKFPEKRIIKIGMQHGVYHFKNFISAKKYNRFDLYFLSSKYEIEEAKKHGMKNLVSTSYPKVDDFFDKEKIEEFEKYKSKFNDKPILLFTATWDKSGLSAVEKWYDKLNLLKNEYHIFVTLHPWISEEFKSKIQSTQGIHFITDSDIAKYLYISDYLIGDTSSVIGEYLALQKPIITFKINTQGRLTQNIVDMIKDISYQIDTFEEIAPTIKNINNSGDIKKEIYPKYIEKLYDLPLGNGGKQRADIIKEFLKERGVLN
jgi:hypothetical protein